MKRLFKILCKNPPKNSSKIMAAFVISCFVTTALIASGRISAGGMTCRRNLVWLAFSALHCLKSPTCPKDPDIVGKPKAAVNDFIVSEPTLVIVKSRTTWGVFFAESMSLYFLHTGNNEDRNSDRMIERTTVIYVF